MQIEVDSWSALKYQLIAWKIYGMLPPPKSSPWRIPYLFLGVFFNVTTISMLTVSLLIYTCLSQSLTDMFENFYVLTASITCFVKFLNCMVFRKDLLAVQPILEKLDSRIHNENEAEIIETAVHDIQSFFLLLLKLLLGIVFSSSVAVYFATERILVFPAWYPWDWKSSRKAHVLTCCLQLYCGVLGTIQETADSAFPQAYLHIVTAHIRTLKLRVLSLGGIDEDDETIRSERNYKELEDCITDHLTILQFVQRIQEVLSHHCMIQFLGTGLFQSALAIYALFVDLDDYSKIMQIIFFFSTLTVEMFILCHCGEKFSTECQELSRAIYDCNWVGQNRRFQKSLLLFLHRSQCSDVIMAGNLIPVNYATFVTVMKSSYSFFTVLRNMK